MKLLSLFIFGFWFGGRKYFYYLGYLGLLGSLEAWKCLEGKRCFFVLFL